MRTAIAAVALSSTMSVAHAAPATNTATLTRIKASMRTLGGQFKDMDTMASLVVTPPQGSADARSNRQITMTARLLVKMPDKVKFQIVNSNLPIVNRWIFIQTGNKLAAYDPVSDRRITTDFRQLTGREPARVDTILGTLGLMFDPSRYRFELLGRSTRQGVPVYKVRLRLLKPQQFKLAMLSFTDLYIDTKRLMPVYSESYDQNGQRAMTAAFSNVVKTPAGWQPTRVLITDYSFEHMDKMRRMRQKARKAATKLTPKDSAVPAFVPDGSENSPNAYRNGTLDLWMGWSNNVIFPWKMIAVAPDGAKTHWVFSKTKVNAGLKDSDFKL